MHTYKTLKELENEASEQKLDHVLNHPFFAKKSSLQEKAMKPETGDGHNHGSEDLTDYETEVKDGMDVTKAKVRKRANHVICKVLIFGSLKSNNRILCSALIMPHLFSMTIFLEQSLHPFTEQKLLVSRPQNPLPSFKK